jgi:hypothetical protein
VADQFLFAKRGGSITAIHNAHSKRLAIVPSCPSSVSAATSAINAVACAGVNCMFVSGEIVVHRIDSVAAQ